MSDNKPNLPRNVPSRPLQTNDRGLPPVQNTLPMPKVQPPKKEK
jgi:hypothetical protein